MRPDCPPCTSIGCCRTCAGRALITWEGSTVTVLDWGRLTELAMFEPIYLHQVRDHAPAADA